MSAPFDPSNLTAVFFVDETSEPISNKDLSSIVYAGPIQVRGCSDNNHHQYGDSGRGLFATRAIAVGELLCIAQPNAYAPVQDVFELYQKEGGRTVSEASEEGLVRVILEKQQQQIDPALHATLQFLHPPQVNPLVDATLMTLLLGGKYSSRHTTRNDMKELTRAEVVQIIRRNAFGPDFTTPETIQTQWQEKKSNNNYPLPNRLLGLYALPAMINHSCVPNAVRVFVKNTMIVHACQPIPAGTEVVWSYIPLIQRHRRQYLLDTHGFVCQCERCQGEATVSLDDRSSSCPPTVEELEELIIPSLPSNELKRYVRMSYLSVYLNELNSLDGPPDPNRWIPLGMHLHLALAACHNASTEHLSILHFLYELETSASKRTFWADQLRRAVMTRYGALGNDVHNVRRMLQHTRTVLRQRNGLQHVQQLNGGVAFI